MDLLVNDRRFISRRSGDELWPELCVIVDQCSFIDKLVLIELRRGEALRLLQVDVFDWGTIFSYELTKRVIRGYADAMEVLHDLSRLV